MVNRFEFGAPEQATGQDSFLLRVPLNLRHKQELLATLAEVGGFPQTFGENWDALSDCLRDLDWIAETHICISHEDLPLRDDPKQCGIYLDILRDAVEDWARPVAASAATANLTWRPHTLRVRFPESARARIQQLMDEPNLD